LLNAKENISVSDSGYIIKPLQPSSAIYGAPPFTGHLKIATEFRLLSE